MAKHPKVDESAYLLLDDIGERVCVAWTLVTEEERRNGAEDGGEFVEKVSHLAVCSFSAALERLESLQRAGILRDDGTVDPVVMKRLRAKGATLVGIGDEPSDGSGDEPATEED